MAAEDQSAIPAEDESAVTALRQLKEERGRSFTEAEYLEIRRAILDELAHGARCRPFTLVTFGAVGFCLLTLLAIGVLVAFDSNGRDWLLAAASTGSLAIWAFLMWKYARNLREDAQRALPERLSEIDDLRAHQLISEDEFNLLRASILMSRQQSPTATTRTKAGS
jgi:hypothetical protein